MANFISMATLQSELVDCRMLHLELEFYELTHPKLKQFAQLCFEGTRTLTDDIFYIDWNWAGRSTKVEVIAEKLHMAKGACDFGFEGDVFSSIVYNAKTYKQYDRKLRYDISTPPNAQCIPVDYPETYAQLFSRDESGERTKHALLMLFSYEKKRNIALWRRHDLMGGLFSCPYENFSEKYHGHFKFSVAVPCLGAFANDFSEQLAQFACKVANSISNVSGRIALSPITPISPCSAHMKYFGEASDTSCVKMGYDHTEWLPYYYLQGAEWFNILSPLQQEHLPTLRTDANSNSDISIEMLPGGGVAVRSCKGIMETDVSEYLSLKKLLYNALYPGKGEIFLNYLYDPEDYSFMAKPRSNWEYAPMLSEEIIVSPDRILFCHGSQNSTK